MDAKANFVGERKSEIEEKFCVFSSLHAGDLGAARRRYWQR
jgi:hypothetical protein